MDMPVEPNAAAEPIPNADEHHSDLPLVDPLSQPVSYWVKKFLICNPFYLVSAALLLYGFYLVSGDANFPGKEIAQLGFNFSALQCYEVLLVGTAIFLARRRIWYDSNLLIFLENGLVLVPFILVSQAALIGQGVVRAMCIIGGAMALIRFGSLKRLHSQFNLPGRLLAPGVVLLAVNVALPLIYRTLNETKLGTKPTDGAAYHLNQCTWLLILPAIVALANALPRPRQDGEFLPQRRWIPTGLFALWLTGTTVHLYSLGYVYNFDWEAPFLVPPLWVLAWTICNRHPDFFRLRGLRPALLTAPAVVTLIAAADSAPRMFLVLTGLNLLVYAILLLREPLNRALRHLSVLSLAALALGIGNWRHTSLPMGLTIAQCAMAACVLYLCYWICLSRQPKLGVLGAILVSFAMANLPSPYPYGPHLAFQAGVLFLLLHSLLWKNESDPDLRKARIVVCGVWLLHSLVLITSNLPHVTLILFTVAMLVLISCVIFKLVRGRWAPVELSAFATVILISSPGNHVIGPAQSVPVGLWMVVGSFTLFALGTILALTKSRWHPGTASVAAASETIEAER